MVRHGRRKKAYSWECQAFLASNNLHRQHTLQHSRDLSVHWEGTDLHGEAASGHYKGEHPIIFASVYSCTYTLQQPGHSQGSVSIFKSKQTSKQKILQVKVISMRDTWRINLADLLNVIFEIPVTFTIIIEMFCTNTDNYPE